MSNKTPHTGVHRGKRVLVKLRTGEEFVDKFRDRSKREVYFESGRVVPRSLIGSFSIYKGPQGANKETYPRFA